MATFQNYATLSYHGQTVVSNLVTGEITAGMSMTKTAFADTYEQGGRVTYGVSILNSGLNAMEGLNLSDDLGAYPFGDGTVTPLRYVAGSARYFINGELQDAPTAAEGPPLVIAGLTVPAGGNALLAYTAETTAYAPLCSGGGIVNTATLTGAGLQEKLAASAEVTPECGLELSITKTLSPAAVAENGEITYTFLITNLGGLPAEAGDNVSVSDVFDPVLREVAVTLDGQALTAAQYSYDAATGSFTTTPGVITVPAADFAQDPDTGIWTSSPGSATLTVTGRI